jgi:DNA (cytosine-5)-methyltransferase 1
VQSVPPTSSRSTSSATDPAKTSAAPEGEGRELMPRVHPDGLPIIDLFAGPGGWDEGLRDLGHEALGIDCDPLACATAEAAGHKRMVADVAALDPTDFASTWGLIASPPCQAFSSAGKGLGKLDKPHVIACARELSGGQDTRARCLAKCKDTRSILTVEPLRWVLALRPRWVAMEQVPAVAALWSIFAELLGAHGYRCAVGLLSAECFGVPQVRKRAFLVASLDGPVELPAPTHRSFHPRRHKPREDELHLPRWRSMAEALGWGCEPAMLRSHNTRSGQAPGGLCRSLDSPSYTVVSSSSHWMIETPPARARKGGKLAAGSSTRLSAACAHHEGRCRDALERGELRSDEVPAWTRSRPATTLLGDPRVTAPGSWPRCGRRAAIVRGRPVRVSVEQAAILQGFPHDYPWQGSRSQRFEQIGNAVPPPVAARVLAEAIRPAHSSGGARRG